MHRFHPKRRCHPACLREMPPCGRHLSEGMYHCLMIAAAGYVAPLSACHSAWCIVSIQSDDATLRALARCHPAVCGRHLSEGMYHCLMIAAAGYVAPLSACHSAWCIVSIQSDDVPCVPSRDATLRTTSFRRDVSLPHDCCCRLCCSAVRLPFCLVHRFYPKRRCHPACLSEMPPCGLRTTSFRRDVSLPHDCCCRLCCSAVRLPFCLVRRFYPKRRSRCHPACLSEMPSCGRHLSEGMYHCLMIAAAGYVAPLSACHSAWCIVSIQNHLIVILGETTFNAPAPNRIAKHAASCGAASMFSSEARCHLSDLYT